MKPAGLAFLWHLHQPPYRLRGESTCFMPWVRLHAVRSYYDMVRVLSEFPDARVTFNLTACLLEQLAAYQEGASDLFRETGTVPAEELDETQRAFLFEHFFAAQTDHMIGDLPRYADLWSRRERALRQRGEAAAWKEFSTEDYRDLQVLFDLSWFGFKAREDFPELRALRRKGRGFSRSDVGSVAAVEDEILQRVLPLYRDAAARGAVEIATSPYAHPILPLLIDTEAARQALPQAALPQRFTAPDDARLQVEEALDLAERLLGVRPRGLWPSEGSVSNEAVELLGRCGIAWAASDDQVLASSTTDVPADPRRPWILASAPGGPALLFRDHDLSDRIGFSYARERPARAAEGFLATVLERGRSTGRAGSLTLVALDGENPWEHYPQAGAAFLRALYGGLARHPAIACETVSEAIARRADPGTIRSLRAGSWIHADFGTWIGGPEKNRAWDLLREVRSAIAPALTAPGTSAEARRAAWASIRAAEGSDWFWWLDGQFATAYRAQFDDLFRAHLRQACEAVGHAAPDALAWAIASAAPREGAGAPAGPRLAIGPRLSDAPRVDGFEGDFFEWHGAARLAWSGLTARGSMQAARRAFESLRYGFTRDGEFCARIDPDPAAGAGLLRGLALDLAFRAGERSRRLIVALDERGDLAEARLEGPGPGPRPSGARARAAARKILELAVPCRDVGLDPGTDAGLRIVLSTASGPVPLREIRLRVPDFERRRKDDAA